MADKPIRIVALDLRHLQGIVEVHLRAFPGFFLSTLGPGFLKEFYAAFLVDAGAFGFIATDDAGCVCGGIVGTVNPSGFFRRLLKRRWWAFLLASIQSLTRHPGIFRRLIRALWYRGEAPGGEERALLSSIAVAPDKQGLGIGKILVERWLDEVRRRGCSGCFLTTDAFGNEGVNGFYQKGGWRIESTYETPEGRKMNRYVLDFEPFARSVR